MSGTEIFKELSNYFDLLYHDKHYESEADYIDDLIRKYSIDAKTILEFGSGTGGHGSLMAKKGYDILGIERSPEMFKIADERSKDSSFTVIQGDIGETDLNKTFDVVISLFHVLCYQTENEQLIKVFNNANRHLKDRGLFIFDCWYTPAVSRRKVKKRIKRVRNDDIEMWQCINHVIHSRRNVVDLNLHLKVKDLKTHHKKVINEIHPERHFSEPEIALLAYFTGFEVLHVEEILSGKNPDIDTSSVIFVLQKTS